MDIQKRDLNLPAIVQMPETVPTVTDSDYKNSQVTFFKKAINFLKILISIIFRKIDVFTTNPIEMTDRKFCHCNLNDKIRFFRGDIENNKEIGVLANTSALTNKIGTGVDLNSLTAKEVKQFADTMVNNCIPTMQEQKTNILTIYLPLYPQESTNDTELDYTNFVKEFTKSIDKNVRFAKKVGMFDKEVIVNIVVPSEFDDINTAINNDAITALNKEVSANLPSIVDETNKFLAKSYTSVQARIAATDENAKKHIEESPKPEQSVTRPKDNTKEKPVTEKKPKKTANTPKHLPENSVKNTTSEQPNIEMPKPKLDDLNQQPKPKPDNLNQQPKLKQSATDAKQQKKEGKNSLPDNQPQLQTKSKDSAKARPLTQEETQKQAKIQQINSQLKDRGEISFLSGYISEILKNISPEEITQQKQKIDDCIQKNQAVSLGSAAVSYGDITDPNKIPGVKERKGVITNAANNRYHIGAGVCGAIGTKAGDKNKKGGSKNIDIQADCQKESMIVHGQKTLPIGAGTASPAHRLKKEEILFLAHVVAPDISDGGDQQFLEDQEDVVVAWLTNSYTSAFTIAQTDPLSIGEKVEYLATPLLGGLIFAVPAKWSIKAFFISMLLNELADKKNDVANFLIFYNFINDDNKNTIAKLAAVYERIKSDADFKQKFNNAVNAT